MREVGIDVAGRTPTKLTAELLTTNGVTLVFTMGCGDKCPYGAPLPVVLSWSGGGVVRAAALLHGVAAAAAATTRRCCGRQRSSWLSHTLTPAAAPPAHCSPPPSRNHPSLSLSLSFLAQSPASRSWTGRSPTRTASPSTQSGRSATRSAAACWTWRPSAAGGCARAPRRCTWRLLLQRPPPATKGAGVWPISSAPRPPKVHVCMLHHSTILCSPPPPTSFSSPL